MPEQHIRILQGVPLFSARGGFLNLRNVGVNAGEGCIHIRQMDFRLIQLDIDPEPGIVAKPILQILPDLLHITDIIHGELLSCVGTRPPEAAVRSVKIFADICLIIVLLPYPDENRTVLRRSFGNGCSDAER